MCIFLQRKRKVLIYKGKEGRSDEDVENSFLLPGHVSYEGECNDGR